MHCAAPDDQRREHAPGRDAEQKASLTFAADRTYVTPMQREITALINDYHQAVADDDEAAMADVRARILADLDDFDDTEGDGHVYPRWICPVMRANAHSAFGELDEALRWERIGAEHAEIDRHKAISANNLSDHHRRLGNHPEAIDAARRAYELWPENDGVIVNLAMALYQAGRKAEAGTIIDRLAALAGATEKTGILGAHLQYEEELREMADLPEVQRLLEGDAGRKDAGNPEERE